MHATAERPIDRFFASYSADHRHPTNQLIHVFAVPAILWSVVALLWCIPVFGTLFKTGVWAALAMFGAWMFYYRLSRPIGFGMLAAFFFMGCLCRLLQAEYGLGGLFLHVAETMGLPPSQVLVLEDGAVGVKAALNGGFPVIGIGPTKIHGASRSLPSLSGVRVADLLALLS